MIENNYVIVVEETYDPPTTSLDENGQGIPYAVYGYGAQMAEISIDIELGLLKIDKITAAHDLGKTINPLLAEGQIEGGIAQGIGFALMEEYIPSKTERSHIPPKTPSKATWSHIQSSRRIHSGLYENQVFGWHLILVSICEVWWSRKDFEDG